MRRGIVRERFRRRDRASVPASPDVTTTGSTWRGTWIFGSPWALKYLDVDPAAWNAFIVGAPIVLLALIELNVPRLWEEGINFVLGLWTIVSPWVLGFAFHGFAMWNAIIVGGLIVAFAVCALVQDTSFKNWWRDHHFV